MSRLRKIYKGEEDWDILFPEGDNPYKENFAKNKSDNTNQLFPPSINNKKFIEDFKNPNNNLQNKNALKLENTTLIENKLNKVSLNKNAHHILHDIDNDNLITEEEVKEFKFENFENEANDILKSVKQNNNYYNNINNNKAKANDMIATEDDYDLFYQMEEENDALPVENDNNYNNNQENETDNGIKELEMHNNYNSNNNNKVGKRTHSEAFGDKENLEQSDGNGDLMPMKIRKIMDD